MTLSIDVVVPVFGKWEVTASCLRHLENQSIEHRVIVVDDASPDDTVNRVQVEFPNVDLVEMKVNAGFAAACNRGMRHGNGDIIVLVNNDVDATPTMLEELVRPFDVEPRVGSAVPLLLGTDGRVDAYGLSADVTAAGYVRFHGANVSAISSESPVLLGPYGAVAAYRRTALLDVGFLDPGIFMYGEELDLAMRLRSANWGVAAVPSAVGIHIGGATAGRGSSRQRYLAGYGRGYLLRKHRITSSRRALRAIATESMVCVTRALVYRDTAPLRGRLAGWHAARHAEKQGLPIAGIDKSITFFASLRMRSSTFWSREK